jgi:hypothetical protein
MKASMTAASPRLFEPFRRGRGMETLINRYSLYTHNVEGRTLDGFEHERKVPLWIDITVTKTDLFVKSVQNLD